MANADVQQMTKNNELESGRSQSARSKMMLLQQATLKNWIFCDFSDIIKPKNQTVLKVGNSVGWS